MSLFYEEKVRHAFCLQGFCYIARKALQHLGLYFTYRFWQV